MGNHHIVKSAVVFIIFLIILPLKLSASTFDPEFYVSPGISFSWGKNTFIGGIKLSAGFFEGYFLNFTIGAKYGVNNKLYSYLYTEFESGVATDIIFSGLGLGAAYLKDEQSKIRVVPKGSIFTGCGLFIRSDILLYQKKVLPDLGGMIVVPFSKSFFDLGKFDMPMPY